MLPASLKVETMSVSQSKVRFLLDENVNKRLEKFLVSKGFDVVSPKGLSNGKLAEFSKLDKRILVTNDDDFADPELYPKDKIFSVVWLKIPQEEPEALLEAFSRLLEEREGFNGYLIVLKKEKSELFSLGSLEYRFPK